MKEPIFTGSATALVTPYTETGVDFEKFKQLLDFQYANGTSAVIISGTTGECCTQPVEEHAALIDFACKYVAGRMKVVAGVGSNCTISAYELACCAKDSGADGILMVTPYYNKSTQRGLIAHYTYVADRVDIPIILYNVPSRTGVNISVETYKELAKKDNIVAAKEASGNISAVAKIAAETDLDIYSGNDDQIVPIMSLGGKGVISVLANCLPTETHEIASYCLEGDYKKAAELQLRLLEFTNDLFIDVNPIPVKEALNIMGKNVGECRLPLIRMEDAKIAKLFSSMEKLGLTK